MSSRNPSAILAEFFAEFSKSAHKAFMEIETQARQEVSNAMVEIRELRAERDKALKDLHAAELNCQSWKQEATASKAALIQAELTITHQAESLAKQIETITQLRREINQWKDQSQNWQEHFLRVERDRCAHSSRIDEIIVDKLQQYAHPFNTPSQLIAQKTSKYSNPGTLSTPKDFPSPAQPLNLKRDSVTPHHSPQASLQAREGPSISGVDSSASSSLSGSRQHMQNSQNQDREKERHRQSDITRRLSIGKKIRNSDNSINQSRYTAPAAVVPQQQSKAMAINHSVNPDVPGKSTVIRRVHAVIHVKHEEDETEDVALPVSPSSSGSGSAGKRQVAVGKRKKDDPVIVEGQPPNRRRKASKKTVTIFSDEDNGESGEQDGPVEDDEEMAGGGSPAYRLRRHLKVDYREEAEEEEEDELMMGAEDNHDELYGTLPVDQSRQQQVGSPKKRRKFAAR